MALTLVEAPEREPLSLDEAKDHLRVDVDDDNALIDALIVAAREQVEQLTGRRLLTQTWDLVLDGFNDCQYNRSGVLWLPFPPVQSITSVSYVDTAGVSQTWDSALYATEKPAGPHALEARLYPKYGESYPVPRSQPQCVTVRFVSGYGDDAEDVPSGIGLAMKFLITHWYENRTSVRIGNMVQTVPQTVDALLYPFMVWRHHG